MIPREVERRLRRRFSVCAYCGGPMKTHRGVLGCPADKATIEHLNRNGPFYWTEGLREKDIVIVCARCNSSRGRKRLHDWFQSPYCRARGINASSVALEVRRYLRTPVAKR